MDGNVLCKSTMCCQQSSPCTSPIFHEILNAKDWPSHFTYQKRKISKSKVRYGKKNGKK